jgi:hypothetical protein
MQDACVASQSTMPTQGDQGVTWRLELAGDEYARVPDLPLKSKQGKLKTATRKQ